MVSPDRGSDLGEPGAEAPGRLHRTSWDLPLRDAPHPGDDCGEQEYGECLLLQGVEPADVSQIGDRVPKRLRVAEKDHNPRGDLKYHRNVEDVTAEPVQTA